MKVAVMVYHSGLDKYKKEWIDKFKDSILNQTFQDFRFYEIDYSGNTNISLFPKTTRNQYITHINQELNNHIEAMNLLIDRIIVDGYDIILNTNVDDYYDYNRFQRQIEILERGYDLVSSNFQYIQEIDGNDVVTQDMFMFRYESDIEEELMKGHNVIAHPVIATTANFWKDFRYDESKLGYEDLDLWQRAIKTKKFKILPDYLLNYRIHDKQVTYGTS